MNVLLKTQEEKTLQEVVSLTMVGSFFFLPLFYPSLHTKYKLLSIRLGFTASTMLLQICS